MKNKIITISILILLIDQITKMLVSNININNIIIPNLLSFKYTENTGVAFSMLSGGRFLIIIISILLLMFILYMINKDYKDNKTFMPNIAFGLLIGGIFGNLIDRIIKGYVIDFISLNIFGYHFPIFNIADLAITIGVILIIILEIKKEKKVSV